MDIYLDYYEQFWPISSAFCEDPSEEKYFLFRQEFAPSPPINVLFFSIPNIEGYWLLLSMLPVINSKKTKRCLELKEKQNMTRK